MIIMLTYIVSFYTKFIIFVQFIDHTFWQTFINVKNSSVTYKLLNFKLHFCMSGPLLKLHPTALSFQGYKKFFKWLKLL
jgi:hypothetical protein